MSWDTGKRVSGHEENSDETAKGFLKSSGEKDSKRKSKRKPKGMGEGSEKDFLNAFRTVLKKRK